MLPPIASWSSPSSPRNIRSYRSSRLPCPERRPPRHCAPSLASDAAAEPERSPAPGCVRRTTRSCVRLGALCVVQVGRRQSSSGRATIPHQSSGAAVTGSPGRAHHVQMPPPSVTTARGRLAVMLYTQRTCVIGQSTSTGAVLGNAQTRSSNPGLEMALNPLHTATSPRPSGVVS